MTFEKDGNQYEVTDPAHIDAFNAKGWKEVIVKEEPKKPVKK